MLTIPVKTKDHIYYINFISDDAKQVLSEAAAQYATITKIINFTIKTISPSDITISDLKNFNIAEQRTTLIKVNSERLVTTPITRECSGSYTNAGVNADIVKVQVTSSASSWEVIHPKYTGNDLQNLGVILSKLISTAHSHPAVPGLAPEIRDEPYKIFDESSLGDVSDTTILDDTWDAWHF